MLLYFLPVAFQSSEFTLYLVYKETILDLEISDRAIPYLLDGTQRIFSLSMSVGAILND